MKKFFQGPLPDHARNLLRRMGYGEQRAYHGQISYVRRMGGGQFPRFHAYVEDQQGGMQVNLHLDQKPHSLGSGAVHGGEYEGTLVEAEMARMAQFIQSLGRPSSSTSAAQTKKSYGDEEAPKGFWGKLFG